MTTIRSEDVKKLRVETGVGMMDCKRALQSADGDFARARQILREQGLELMGQQGREASEGRVECYVHHSATIGAIVEIACNTDFAAKSVDFVQFSKDLALHIAASNPRYIAPENVPPADLDQEREVYRAQLEKEGKPAHIIDKAVEGRLNRFYEDTCLLKQAFAKDPTVRVEDLLADLRTKTGENILIKRFARYEVGAGGA
ncbi:MAG: translation elongation factor Ts [Candidatus Bipolaricaulis sp.]|nr:translation elongation factor Ts [Candidatus Bipolaricaulis sp.]MDD5646169.1 translation elongation factor Ts [Candidatus Bipolaricaulis sp.]